jgi:hypothetical protein
MVLEYKKNLERGDEHYEIAMHLIWLYNNSDRVREHIVELEGGNVLHMDFKKDRWVCRVLRLEEIKVG